MRTQTAACLLAAIAAVTLTAPAKEKDRRSAIERYIEDAESRAAKQYGNRGSLYTPVGLLGDSVRDLRASQVDDIVTIVVADRAAAVSRGGTSTGRKSSARSSITSLLGVLPETSALANLAELGGSRKLEGQGETSRETSFKTTISARVTHVLPNGFLVVEGVKNVWINSERQEVTVRGVVRWSDIGSANQVLSDRLANLEVHVNGKGVVGDAIRRPNFLYRLLLGILPF